MNLSSIEIFVHEIGVAEPPTIAEMEKELRTLPSGIDPDGDEMVDRYINKKPKQKPTWNRTFLIGIVVTVIIIFAAAGIGVSYYYYSRSGNIRRTDSDTSN